MHIQRLLNLYAWPVAAGVIIALLALLLFPQLRHKPLDTASAQTAPANSFNGPVSYADAVSRAAPAVVNIYTEKRVKDRYQDFRNNPIYRHLYNNSNLPQQERMEKTLGSGVIVNNSGLILTNNHVINGADKILVLLYDGRALSAELVGTDPENDLAVLRIGLDNLRSISLGDSDKVRVGDVVLAIGNPFGVGQSVSQGIVSATGRWNVGISEEATYENFIQTDAAINPGNSGGALIDAYGNLVGINTAMLDETGASVGISFAVPINTAIESLAQILDHGRVIRGWLGFQGEEYKQDGISGILINGLYRQGPAHIAGLQFGDIITEINHIAITGARQCGKLVAKIPPGSRVSLHILRKGEAMDLEAIAAERDSGRTKT